MGGIPRVLIFRRGVLLGCGLFDCVQALHWLGVLLFLGLEGWCRKISFIIIEKALMIGRLGGDRGFGRLYMLAMNYGGGAFMTAIPDGEGRVSRGRWLWYSAMSTLVDIGPSNPKFTASTKRICTLCSVCMMTTQPRSHILYQRLSIPDALQRLHAAAKPTL